MQGGEVQILKAKLNHATVGLITGSFINLQVSLRLTQTSETNSEVDDQIVVNLE
jgi:hypothetical protein